MPDPVVESPVAAVVEVVPPPEPVVAEPAPTEKPPEKPKPGEFAAKAKAEREKVQRVQAEKARAEELTQAKAERDALKAKIAEQEERRKGYVKNPVQALMDSFPGMDPAKAAELIMETARNGGKAPVAAETYELRQRLDEMESKREAEAKAQQEERQAQAKAQAQAAETAFRSEVSDFVKEHAETYELTALYDQHAAVYEVIEAVYSETGKIISTKEAAEKVEAKLEEMADRAMKTKKIAAKFRAPEDKGPRTLTNDMAIPATLTGPAKSEQERMDRARLALEKLGI
jgi:hypothetical protein